MEVKPSVEVVGAEKVEYHGGRWEWKPGDRVLRWVIRGSQGDLAGGEELTVHTEEAALDLLWKEIEALREACTALDNLGWDIRKRSNEEEA